MVDTGAPAFPKKRLRRQIIDDDEEDEEIIRDPVKTKRLKIRSEMEQDGDEEMYPAAAGGSAR